MLNFNRVLLLYLGAMIVFLAALASNVNFSKSPVSEPQRVAAAKKLPAEEKAMLTQHLVDQLVENNQAYDNNVWTTLATIMLAIGMLLTSEKFAHIVTEHPGSVQAIHWIVFMLFCLHLVAYYLYQLGSDELLGKMHGLVSDMSYYEKYSISDVRLILNSVFDFFLFLLLSFIVDSFRKGK